MTFNNIYNISDIVSIFTFISIIIGGIFTLYQYNQSIKLKRADYINDLTNTIRSDLDISDSLYLIEYGEKWYSQYFHGSGELERKMDKTLSYFSYICYLKKQKIISKNEFYFFKYEIDRILMNNQIIDYLYNLYHFSKKFSDPMTFQYLFEYGEENCFFNKDFYNKESYIKASNIYHKYINT